MRLIPPPENSVTLERLHREIELVAKETMTMSHEWKALRSIISNESILYKELLENFVQKGIADVNHRFSPLGSDLSLSHSASRDDKSAQEGNERNEGGDP